jgi:hypothetical protein
MSATMNSLFTVLVILGWFSVALGAGIAQSLAARRR